MADKRFPRCLAWRPLGLAWVALGLLMLSTVRGSPVRDIAAFAIASGEAGVKPA